jgi:hypothetical protein
VGGVDTHQSVFGVDAEGLNSLTRAYASVLCPVASATIADSRWELALL